MCGGKLVATLRGNCFVQILEKNILLENLAGFENVLGQAGKNISDAVKKKTILIWKK